MRGSRWGRRARIAAAALALAATLPGCQVSFGTRAPGSPSPRDPEVIVVGSFDFAESEILAELYAGSLRRHGFRVEVRPAVGPRELLQPALERGLVDLVPEYLGAALGFVAAIDGSVREPTADVNDTYEALAGLLEPRGLVALEPAPAQDANGFAVTRETAERYGLRTLSDLAEVAAGMVLGGPPECPDRPLCLPGLEGTYGLGFESFSVLDASGPVTAAALRAGEVDVALMFTTSPYLAEGDLVLLRDDRGLQPAENVVPVIRDDRLEPSVEAAIEEVSRRLLSADLVELNRQVVLDGRAPADVASAWLEAKGIGD